MASIAFHAKLVTAGVWAADLVTAGIVSAAAAVHEGRLPREPKRTDTEVWLEIVAADPVGTGFQGLTPYPYLVHVRVGNPGNRGPDKTGALQLQTLNAHLDTLVERYQGTRFFFATVPEIYAVTAAKDVVDETLDGKGISGTVRVTFYTTDTITSATGDPISILGASLAAWFDADDAATITTTGIGVSSWSNKAPGGTPSAVAQSLDADRPAVVAAATNGRAGLEGFGVGDRRWLEATGNANMPVTAAPFYIWAVVKPDNVASRVYAINDLSIDNDILRHHTVNPTAPQTVARAQQDDPAFSAVLSVNSPAFVAGDVVLLETRATGVADHGALHDAGTEVTNTTSVAPPAAALDQFSVMTHLDSGGHNLPLDGIFHELVIASAIPSALQIRQIRNYLGDKWGEIWT